MSFHILVITTGGTIGSHAGRETVGLEPGAPGELIGLYQREYGGRDIRFERKQPYYVLSEDSTPENWTKLSELFSELDVSRYQGIIVTHGSDTLPYTSSLLGLLYGWMPLPVVVTGSSAPLGEPGSNGLTNFAAAVSFIRGSGLKGVFTIFGKSSGEQVVYLSTRLLEADSYQDEFQSFGGVSYGRMEGERFVVNANPINPSAKELASGSKRILKEPVRFSRPVCFLKPYPGLSYESLSFREEPAAVLHGLYHSGTACTKGGAYSLPDFVKRCAGKGIPVYAGPLRYREKPYETGREILRAGAKPLWNISPEAAYMKLCIAYNQKEMSPEALLEQNCFYEILPDPAMSAIFGG